MSGTDRLKKILLIRLGALGDILHALPAFQGLAEALPSTRFHWLCEPAYLPLLQCVPGLERIWTADTKRWRDRPTRFRELFPLSRALRRQSFDLAIDFQGLLKSALLSRLSGARRVLGFQPERFKETGSSWFYHAAIPGEADLSMHVIQTNGRLASQAIPIAPPSPRVQLQIPPADRRYIAHCLAERGLESPVLINPGAGWVTKLWPAADYARLSLRLEQELGVSTLFTYGPGEEALIEQIRKVRKPEETATFPSTIVQLAELCNRARLMIAGDSGPLHLAVSQGTATVAILGPTAATRNGPANLEDEVVKRNLPCSDSYKRQCNEFICMDIPVDTVFQAVRRRLEKMRPLAVS